MELELCREMLSFPPHQEPMTVLMKTPESQASNQWGLQGRRSR